MLQEACGMIHIIMIIVALRRSLEGLVQRITRLINVESTRECMDRVASNVGYLCLCVKWICYGYSSDDLMVLVISLGYKK